MIASAASHPGLVREKNEDGYLMLLEQGFFAVADGMGGHLAGAEASHLALEILAENAGKLDPRADPSGQLTEVVREANRQVFEQGKQDRCKRGMGTTLTVLWVMDQMAHIAHVGDSRAYLLRGKEISSLTRDHSLVEELRRSGTLSATEAQNHPQKNILMRAIGIESTVDADLISFRIQPKDLLFLCTDGLSNLISPKEISRAFLDSSSLDKALGQMVDLALRRGGPDNITGLAVLLD